MADNNEMTERDLWFIKTVQQFDTTELMAVMDSIAKHFEEIGLQIIARAPASYDPDYFTNEIANLTRFSESAQGVQAAAAMCIQAMRSRQKSHEGIRHVD